MVKKKKRYKCERCGRFREKKIPKYCKECLDMIANRGCGYPRTAIDGWYG